MFRTIGCRRAVADLETPPDRDDRDAPMNSSATRSAAATVAVTALVATLLLIDLAVDAPASHTARDSALPSTSTTMAGCTRDRECGWNERCVAGTCEMDGDRDGLADFVDPCPSDPRNRCYGTVAIDSATGNFIRINASVSATAECAGSKLDCNGEMWIADFGWNVAGEARTCNLDASTEGCAIAGIADIFGCTDEATEDLFQCEHADAESGPDLAYRFDVPDGDYLVNLFFADTETATAGIGRRVFDIVIEDNVAYGRFDPVAAAPGSGTALVRSALTRVSNGDGLRIELGRVHGDPALKALEVLTAAPWPVRSALSSGPTRIWIAAGADSTALFQGAMTTGTQFTGGADADAAADNLASPLAFAASTVNSYGGGSADKVIYTITIPSAGVWYLWGRFYYPDPAANGANSFWAQVDEGPLVKFGNNQGFARKWHWGGNGMIETGPLAPLPLGTIAAGTHRLTIEKREVVSTPPRLDLLLLTNQAADLPTDAEAGRFLGICASAVDCNDGNPCTTDTCNSGVCSHVAGGASCNDGLFCNGVETCDPVLGCAASSSPCDDGVACTTDACSEPSDSCSHVPDHLACGDANPCTDDTCNTATGCQYGTNTLPCDDGISCTTADVCSAGVCAGVEDCPPGRRCDVATGACAEPDLWIPAATHPSAVFAGAMTTSAAYAGGADADPVTDSFFPTLVFANSPQSQFAGGSGDMVSYTVELPQAGNWFLWGRFYYPDASASGANSFFAKVDAGPLLKFGNNRDQTQRWHWDGDGAVEVGALLPLSLGFLSSGTHALIIEKREAVPTPPRLDLLFLTSDPAGIPSDADAAEALGACAVAAQCNDDNTCTNDGCVAASCVYVAGSGPCSDGLACTAADACTAGQCVGTDTCAAGFHCDGVTGSCQSDGPTTTTLPEPIGLWIPAGTDPTAVFAGAMTSGTPYTGGADADANADNLITPLVFADSTQNAFSGASNDRVRYSIDLPHAGEWFLWARLYYPDAAANGANSFLARVDAGPALKLGNKRDHRRVWHWDGDGALETGPLAALSLGVLAAGPHQLTIEKREVLAIPPRVDVLYLTDHPMYVPTDREAADAFGLCLTAADCDDGNPCTTDVCSAGTCSHGYNNASCNDGIACTGSDTCNGGICAGTDICLPGWSCNPATGLCERDIATTTTTTTTTTSTTSTTTTTTTTLPTDDDNDGLFGGGDPCPADPRNRCFGPAAVEAGSGTPLRINANSSAAECSGARVDCNGDAWGADFGFSTPSASSTCNLNGGGNACVIAGLNAIFGCDSAATQDLFQCERFSNPATQPPLRYAWNVANGDYLVNLYFANTFTGTTGVGQRVFDIVLEGMLTHDDFDAVADAPGSGVAVVRSGIVTVADGVLDIDFDAVVENPAVKAIEVLAKGTPNCAQNADCDDVLACTTDLCNPISSTCTTIPNHATCGDGNPCTDDACNLALGCVNTANTLPCDDGLTCSAGDVCHEGVCKGANACPLGQACEPASGVCETSFTHNGTQPGLTHPVIGNQDCKGCHGNFDTAAHIEPWTTWSGSMMGQAGRDPLFWAALDVANNDVPGIGDWCLRCHAPKAWLEGRAEPPAGSTDGCGLLGKIDEWGGDFDGLDCHTCHRMTINDDPPPGQSSFFLGNGEFWIDDGNCNGVPCRLGPYDYPADGTPPPHEWAYSSYHESSDMCGACHNVTSPARTLIDDGIDTGVPFPIERTYDEWLASDFGPSGATFQTCQGCHMPDATKNPAYASSFGLNNHSGDLPIHQFAGGNAWVPDVLRGEYPNLGIDANLVATRDWALDMLQNRSALVELNAPTAFVPGQSLDVAVRVTNLTGHKLPTGYPEGRRMWLNVQARDGSSTVFWESGAYDPATGVLTEDVQLKVYEVKQGIWNLHGTGACDTEDTGSADLFHFTLNDCVALDNRIPPLGFDAAGDIEIAPVNHVFPEAFPGSGILVNYDDTDYSIPIPAGIDGPVQLTATLRYQTSSKEYVEFLAGEATDNGFPNDCIERTGGLPGMSRGEVLHDMWTRHGRAAPVDMDAAGAFAEGPCTVAADCDDGNPCTTDACVGSTCQSTNNTASCNDGIACTSGDTCANGNCAGVSDCPGGVCNVVTGQCDAARIYIPAAIDPSAQFQDAMTHDTQFAGGADADPTRNSLIARMAYANSTDNALTGGSGDQVAYTVVLPQTGNWYLWGRMYYPSAPGSNGPNSFLVSMDGGPTLKLGNSSEAYQQFHWDGDATSDTGPHTALLLGAFSAGSHQLVVEKREVAGGVPPRLDVLMLTQNPADVPSDSEAVETLELALAASPAQLVWGQVELGTTGATKNVTLTNTGSNPITVSSLSFRTNAGSGEEFTATAGGTGYSGGAGNVTHPIGLVVPAGGSVLVPVVFAPAVVRDNDVSLVFGTSYVEHTVALLGTGASNPTDPYLDVVINAAPVTVDYDQDGAESVFLSGSQSSTVEPGRSIVAYQWQEGVSVLSTSADTFQSFGVGAHTVTLTIFDDNVPAQSLAESAPVAVAAPDEVPGALALYYDAGAGTPGPLLDAVPATASFAEVLPTLEVDANNGKVGGSSLTGNVMVRLVVRVDVASPGTYTFAASGGSDRRLYVNGAAGGGPVFLAAGSHDVEARFAVNTVADLPVSVTLAQGAGAQQPIDAGDLTHDQLGMAPVVNSGPTSGAAAGGDPVVITGLGFFPANQVSVHWGGNELTQPTLSITPSTISFLTPAGQGLVSVTVETPNGLSNVLQFSYDAGPPPPIVFALSDLATVPSPTQAAWGPDHRLYVTSTDGAVRAYTFNDSYNVTATQVITVLQNSGLAEKDIMGIAFDPFDPPGEVHIYIGHSDIFAQGGGCNFQPPFPYIGRVSRISGPSFSTLEPVITGLPSSNHDHVVNGMTFDNSGDLLFAMGGNTNSGVEACTFGGIPESPLSGAILRAELSQGVGFNGAISYVTCAQPFGCSGGTPSTDQVSGHLAGVVAGVDVSVFAPGMRNSFDLVYTTAGRLYNTDNGGDPGLGPTSTGASTQGPDPDDIDTVNHVVAGDYYGHPNRNRGRTDARQNLYHSNAEASIPGVFTQAMFATPSSTNGIDEYRALTFRGAMRGNLIVQKWNGPTRRVTLSSSGTAAQAVTDLNVSLNSLDVTAGPAGVLVGADFTGGKLVLATPNDAAATGLTVYDIFPWRAPISGGHAFVIGGSGFGTLANTTVTIDGVAASLTSVSATRIRGLIPPRLTVQAGPVGVVVTVGSESRLLPAAFRYLPAAP